MAFFSWQFILFLTVSLAVYYIVPGRFRWLVLLASSAWYYVVGGGLKSCVYVLVTVITTYLGAVIIDNMQRKVDEQLKGRSTEAGTVKLSREEKKQLKALGQKKKKRVLVLVLLINFGILIVLKYGSFISINMNGLLSALSTPLDRPRSLIPLGLSFYTFQTMGHSSNT